LKVIPGEACPYAPKGGFNERAECPFVGDDRTADPIRVRWPPPIFDLVHRCPQAAGKAAL
jgi:hypothetical protein